MSFLKQIYPKAVIQKCFIEEMIYNILQFPKVRYPPVELAIFSK